MLAKFYMVLSFDEGDTKIWGPGGVRVGKGRNLAIPSSQFEWISCVSFKMRNKASQSNLLLIVL